MYTIMLCVIVGCYNEFKDAYAILYITSYIATTYLHPYSFYYQSYKLHKHQTWRVNQLKIISFPTIRLLKM